MDDLTTYEGRRAWIENAERAMREECTRERKRQLRHELDEPLAQLEMMLATRRMLDECGKRAEQKNALADTYTFVA